MVHLLLGHGKVDEAAEDVPLLEGLRVGAAAPRVRDVSVLRADPVPKPATSNPQFVSSGYFHEGTFVLPLQTRRLRYDSWSHLMVWGASLLVSLTVWGFGLRIRWGTTGCARPTKGPRWG